jgi:DNA-binding LytR/AlgR family response regulator
MTLPETAPTALIADDEEAPRTQLREALRTAWPQLRLVAECRNGVDAWDAVLEHQPQVCFLDIRMPGFDGLEVARRIGRLAHVVFVTAHGDHALAAFDAGAVDYVLKPVEPARLAQAVARLQARLEQPPRDLVELLQSLAASRLGATRRPTSPVIQAAVGREVRLIPIEEVVYFESDSRYTRVVHRDGEALIRTPLKELLAELDPDRFWQVHRSVIVARDAIAAAVRVDENTMTLSLRGRTERLPVSRPFQPLFRPR